MIELQKVSKLYKSVTAVADVSFTVDEGETLVLLGTSGCGKTTTLRMVNRLTQPSSGSIVVNGQNIMNQEEEKLRRGIGYVLQHTGLFPHYTIAQNISIVPQLLKWSNDKILKRIHQLLEKLQLDPREFSDKFPSQLSGGQQQRVGLARALAANPPVLLMDEPFGALDPVTRNGIRKEFKQLDELKRKTILMVTHDVQEAFELGNRICLMHNGKIVQIGTPAELLFKPATAFVDTFLKEQRLQLQLHTITLKNIFNSLPDYVINSDNPELMDTNTSLWTAMERITSGKPAQNFITKSEQHYKQVTIQNIMAAFATIKTNNTNG